MIPQHLLLLLALAATPALAEVSVIDGAGREVVLAAPPERVVALYNDAFGQMATLGIRPVATLVNPEMAADEAYYFEDGAGIPLVGNADGSPDPEVVASFEPDLILGRSEEEAASMEDIAPFFVMDGGVGVEGVEENLRAIAAVLGVPERAEQAIAAFDARVAAYAARVPARPTVLKLSASGPTEFWFGTVGDPVCPLLDLVVTCAWPNAAGEAWGYQGTLEQALALDPDVIVLNNWTEAPAERFLAGLEADPLWGELRAVREGRVVFQPEYSNPIFSSIAAGTKALDTLIPAIFPEAFPTGALTDAEVAAALRE